ncbi:site-2 protease family protein, partial [Coxiella burnetii]
MSFNNIVHIIAVVVLPLLFAITLHEAAHGWVANKLGDKTALMMGRVTLNPLKHIDPFGTVILPILILILSKFTFAFGWAKPVPVTWQNLRKLRRDMALVAVAGP